MGPTRIRPSYLSSLPFLSTVLIIRSEFFIACLVYALEHVHKNDFIHKDVKPENLVFEENGYLRLTDFGIARMYQPDNSKDTQGTQGYVSPEVFFGQNYK